jgi:hypothetical protein
MSRVTAVRSWRRSPTLLPPFNPPLSFSLWPASHCSLLFSFPYLFQPMPLLFNSHSLILMGLSTLPKVGAGPIAVSRLYSRHHPPFDALLPFQGLSTDAIQIESINVSPDPPKPGQNLTVIVEAYATEEVKVRLHTKIPYSPDRIISFFRRVHMQMWW